MEEKSSAGAGTPSPAETVQPPRQTRKEWCPLVKGTSRRVIVVDSPDPKLFEQAIFIVKNDAMTREGVTSQQVLGEACRIARGYAAAQTVRLPLWQRVPRWAWIAGAAVAASAVWLVIALL